MKTDIKVSIVVPLYNGERFIETAIRSVLDCNIPWVEFVVVNDGSSDSSDQICRKYQGDNFQYIVIENSGAGYARNRGIEASRGQWITFLDSDDMMFGSEFDASWYSYLEAQKDKGTDIIYLPKVECNMELSDVPQITYPESVENIKNFIPEIEFWSCFYRAEYLKEKNIRFFEYQKQDIESAFRFRAFSNTKNIVVNSNKAFIVHRNNPTSNVNTWKIDDLCEIKAKVYLQLFKEFNNKVPEISYWLYGEYASFLRHLILNSLKHGFPLSGTEQIREMVLSYDKSIRKERNTPLTSKDKIFFVGIEALKIKCFWTLFTTICNRKTREEINNQVKVAYEFDNIELLLSRLNDYQNIVNKELDK